MNTNATGLIGALLNTLAFVPQVINRYKTESVKDLSIGLSLLLFTGTMLWIVYGIKISEFPVIISNRIIMILNGSLLVFKVIYKSS